MSMTDKLKESIWNTVYNDCLMGCIELHSLITRINKVIDKPVDDDYVVTGLSYIMQGCRDNIELFKNTDRIINRKIIVSLLDDKYFRKVVAMIDKFWQNDMTTNTNSVSLPIKNGKMQILIINTSKIDRMKKNMTNTFINNGFVVKEIPENVKLHMFILTYVELIRVLLNRSWISNMLYRYKWWRRNRWRELTKLYNDLLED